MFWIYHSMVCWELQIEFYTRTKMQIKMRGHTTPSLEEAYCQYPITDLIALLYISMHKMWEYIIKYIPTWKSLLQPNAQTSLITFLYFYYSFYFWIVNREFALSFKLISRCAAKYLLTSSILSELSFPTFLSNLALSSVIMSV